MFQRVYLGEAARQEHARIERVLRGLFDWFCEHPDELPPGVDGRLARRARDRLHRRHDRPLRDPRLDRAGDPAGLRCLGTPTTRATRSATRSTSPTSSASARSCGAAGVNRLVGLCPFHDERSPSFGIDPVEKLYHCFGCGAGGDLFTFVMETESRRRSARRWSCWPTATTSPLERTEEDPRAAERRARRDRLLALLERTAAYYVRMLWESAEAAGRARVPRVARARARRCAASSASATRRRPGTASSARPQRAGYTDDELLAAGLASRTRDGSGPARPLPRPAHVPVGRLARPRARLRRARAEPRTTTRSTSTPPRARSSPRAARSTGRTSPARPPPRPGPSCSSRATRTSSRCTRPGVRNAVGQMGTALTEGQAAELAKLAPSVTLCLDADRAGQEATLQGRRRPARAAQPARGPRRRRCPPGTDPAEVATGEDGGDAVRDLLDRRGPARALASTWRSPAATSTSPRAATACSPTPPRHPPRPARPPARGARPARRRPPRPLGGTRRRPPCSGRPRHRSARAERRRAAPAAPLDHAEEAERAFLALCLALPEGRRRAPRRARPRDGVHLRARRRAALHLRDHLDAPAAGLQSDDEALSALIAELVLRARALEDTDSAAPRPRRPACSTAPASTAPIAAARAGTPSTTRHPAPARPAASCPIGAAAGPSDDASSRPESRALAEHSHG